MACAKPSHFQLHVCVQARACKPKRVTEEDVLAFLPCRTIAFVGDSITRLLYTSLHQLLVSSSEKKPLTSRKHGDMSFEAPGHLRVLFYWRPYAANLTMEVREWSKTRKVPDAVVFGASLWHVLHVTDVVAYEAALQDFRQAWEELQSNVCCTCHLKLSQSYLLVPVACSVPKQISSTSLALRPHRVSGLRFVNVHIADVAKC
jgi:hypothetical protein